MNEIINKHILSIGETLIICKNMNEVEIMERHLILEMCHPENYINSVGDVTFQFYDGIFIGWCHERWFDEECFPGTRKKIYYSAMIHPTFIEVDDV